MEVASRMQMRGVVAFATTGMQSWLQCRGTVDPVARPRRERGFVQKPRERGWSDKYEAIREA